MTAHRAMHRRSDDDEPLGWIHPEGDGFVAIDLLGRRRTGVVAWFQAEDALDDLGLDYLDDVHEMHRDDGVWVRVRIVDVSRDSIRVKEEAAAHATFHTLSLPVPEGRLRARR